MRNSLAVMDPRSRVQSNSNKGNEAQKNIYKLRQFSIEYVNRFLIKNIWSWQKLHFRLLFSYICNVTWMSVCVYTHGIPTKCHYMSHSMCVFFFFVGWFLFNFFPFLLYRASLWYKHLLRPRPFYNNNKMGRHENDSSKCVYRHYKYLIHIRIKDFNWQSLFRSITIFWY